MIGTRATALCVRGTPNWRAISGFDSPAPPVRRFAPRSATARSHGGYTTHSEQSAGWVFLAEGTAGARPTPDRHSAGTLGRDQGRFPEGTAGCDGDAVCGEARAAASLRTRRSQPAVPSGKRLQLVVATALNTPSGTLCRRGSARSVPGPGAWFRVRLRWMRNTMRIVVGGGGRCGRWRASCLPPVRGSVSVEPGMALIMSIRSRFGARTLRRSERSRRG